MAERGLLQLGPKLESKMRGAYNIGEEGVHRRAERLKARARDLLAIEAGKVAGHGLVPGVILKHVTEKNKRLGEQPEMRATRIYDEWRAYVRLAR